MRWLGSITDSTDMNLSKLWEIVEDRATWRATVYGVTKSWTQLNSNEQERCEMDGWMKERRQRKKSLSLSVF